MPMFLDRHELPGVSAEDVARAHMADLGVQEKYGVRYHTYWFDPEKCSVFCLAEGPDRESIETVHREAHGFLASNLVELDSMAPLNDFMGPMPTHPAGEPYVAPGMRAIVFTDVCGSVAQTQELGDDGHMVLLAEHNDLVRTGLGAHEGREIKHTGDGIMAAFTSVVAAVNFAVEVQRSQATRNSDAEIPFHISIGISAGEPITGDDGDLFGAAVQLAARLCNASGGGDIFVSSAVRELCMGKPIRFDDKGKVKLKGIKEATKTFAVAWHEPSHKG